jgi:SAM-dependent methyltransferase
VEGRRDYIIQYTRGGDRIKRESERNGRTHSFKYHIEKYIEDLEADGYEAPHIMTPFGKKLVELAKIEKGARILDLGMGAGTSLFPAAEKAGATGQVIGIDICKDMVRYTHEKIKKYKVDNACVIQADAQSLVFKDNSFDYVLSGFSYIFSTLEEIRRVLRKGGRFGLSTWKTLEYMEWMASCLGKYIPVNSKDVYSQVTLGELRTLLDEAGFTNIVTSTETQLFHYADEEQWWRATYDSGWEDYIKKIEDMGAVRMEEFKKEAFKELQIYKKSDSIPFVVCVHFVFGTK